MMLKILFSILLAKPCLDTKPSLNIEQFTLQNGLQVYLIPNYLGPIVSVNLCYKVGTADDPLAIVGISHFLEHLMFKGSKNFPGSTFTKTMATRGAMINAFTTFDYTNYTADIDVKFLPELLQMEADRMCNLQFDAKEVEAEKKVVQEERKMTYDNDPMGLATEALMRSVYLYHPYGIMPIGYPHNIAAYNMQNAQNHYKKWYVVNNAVLLISGPLDVKTLKPMVEKYFAHIKPGKLTKRVRVKEPRNVDLTQEIFYKHPRIANAQLRYYFLLPADYKKEDFYALLVARQIFGGSVISRLHKVLVEEKHLANEMELELRKNLDPGHFQCAFILDAKAKLSDLEKEFKKQLHDLYLNGVTDKELANAKRDINSNWVFLGDGPKGNVQVLNNIVLGFDAEDIASFPQKINNVTKEAVHAIVKRVFSNPPRVIAKVLPEKKLINKG